MPGSMSGVINALLTWWTSREKGREIPLYPCRAKRLLINDKPTREGIKKYGNFSVIRGKSHSRVH